MNGITTVRPGSFFLLIPNIFFNSSILTWSLIGNAQNFLELEHVKQIFDWYKNDQDVENFVKVVNFEEIKENDYNLNIPLYVEKIIEDNLPSAKDAIVDLKEAWKEAQVAEEKFKQKLKEFGMNQ